MTTANTARALPSRTAASSKKAGVETVLFEAVTPDAVDFSAVVRKLRRAKADVLIFGGYQNTASKLVQQMRRDRVKDPPHRS